MGISGVNQFDAGYNYTKVSKRVISKQVSQKFSMSMQVDALIKDQMGSDQQAGNPFQMSESTMTVSERWTEMLVYSAKANITGSTATKGKFPYSYLANNGVIEYNKVTFECDPDKNAICLGDTSDMDKCITIPLSEGGCLIVNRNKIDALSRAIGMFTPEDINRILSAISTDRKLREAKLEIEEDKNGIGDSKKSAPVEKQDKTNSAKNTNQEEDENSLISKVHNKINELFTKLKNGDTQPVFQIGGKAFTQKEWDDLLTKVDSAIDDMKEQIKAQREQLEKDTKQGDKENQTEENKEEDTTDSNIVVKPDGSRILVITINIGGIQSTKSIKLSDATEETSELGTVETH